MTRVRAVKDSCSGSRFRLSLGNGKCRDLRVPALGGSCAQRTIAERWRLPSARWAPVAVASSRRAPIHQAGALTSAAPRCFSECLFGELRREVAGSRVGASARPPGGP